MKINPSIRKRKKSDRNFKILSFLMVFTTVTILFILLFSIISRAYTGFIKTEITLSINLDKNIVAKINKSNDFLECHKLIKAHLQKSLLNELNLDGKEYKNADLSKFFSNSAYVKFYNSVKNNNINIKEKFKFLASTEVDIYLKKIQKSEYNNFTYKEIFIMEEMIANNILSQGFNNYLFTNTDSREPEMAGMLGSIIGSLLTLSICIAISFPIGVTSALYLEEFSKKNFLNYIIETSINNLSAIPSIIYGILGLAFYINFLGIPRSTPLVGGLTLAMMILPTIILSSRNALRAIPQSIRDAAIGMGASKMQMIKHHIIPLAMPGIMTGTILGIARAMGETAPLLMVGMVAFIIGTPSGIMDPATVIPVQIFIWSDSPEPGFIEKTSAAIIVLLAILLLFNMLAIYIRNKYQHKWE